MTTDNHEPIINNWFEENIIYEGEGYAEFSNPKGWIRGHAKVTFDQSGTATTTLDVQEYEGIDTDNEEFYLSLISGGGDYQLIKNPSQVKCDKFEVITQNGKFKAKQTELIGHYFPTTHTLNFHFYEAEYITNNLSPIDYWVIPLTNFVSNIFNIPFKGNHLLDKHPMRICTVPRNLLKATENEYEKGIYNHKLRSCFIDFGFGDKLGDFNVNTPPFIYRTLINIRVN